MTISQVSGFPTNVTVASGTSISQSVTLANVGDLVLIAIATLSSSITVSSVTCVNLTGITLVESYPDTHNGQLVALYMATVATTGSATITATSSASTSLWMVTDSFTTSPASTWSVVTSGGAYTTTGSTLVYPSLTSGSAANQLYWGYGFVDYNATAGSTPGFTYWSPYSAEGCKNLSLAASTVYAPTAGLTGPGSTAVGVIIQAVSSSSPTPLRTRHPISQAVSRAANWAKRESGLWSPESGLIPRAA